MVMPVVARNSRRPVVTRRPEMAKRLVGARTPVALVGSVASVRSLGPVV